MRLSKIRGLVAVLVFVLAGVSLATHAATGTLSAFGIDSIAAICPLGALEAMFGVHGVLLHPLLLLLAMVVVTLIVGKAFCSWVCPTPWIRSFFHRSRKRQKDEHRDQAAEEEAEGQVCQREQRLDSMPGESTCAACGGARGHAGCALAPRGGERDGFHLDTRFAVLGGTLLSAAIFGFPVFCLICPVGLAFAVFIGVWHLFQFGEATWGLVVFPAILIVEVVVMRKWCHAFCPISALLSLISTKNRLLRPRVDASKCLRSRGIDCRVCTDVCPESVDPHSPGIPECSKCGLCKDSCPAHAISIPLLYGHASKKESDTQ